MKKLLLFILFPSLLLSCIWIDGTTIDGEYTNDASTLAVMLMKQNISTKSSQTKLKQILENSNIKKRSKNEQEEFDAIVLLLKGKYQQSIEKLLTLDKKSNNKYSIASNLGTAYELSGNNIEALKWITEGIKRDTSSHYGTEWLHQLILKTKIQLQENPNWLKTHRIIPLPSKFDIKSNVIIENKTYNINEIQRALNYQLRERIIFVKPKDVIVADLFYTLARISAQLSSVEKGLGYLELSKLYGFSQPKLLKKREKFYTHIQENPSWSYYFQKIFKSEIFIFVVFLSIIGIVLILLKIFLVFIYKKLFKEKS